MWRDYNFGSLLNDEYFSQHPKGKDLAKALWSTFEITRSERTLFMLDGLDEVSQDLDGNMLLFLRSF
jgi:predicted NACHT family NTPase